MFTKKPSFPLKITPEKVTNFPSTYSTSRLIVRIAILSVRLLMAIEITGIDASNFIVPLGVNSFVWLVREITDCLLAL